MTTLENQIKSHAIDRKDLHQKVTDIIVKQLEEGTVPWQQPWKGNADRIFGIPRNAVTGKRYNGINIPLLWSSGMTHPEWASFKQWNQKFKAIRKGEKGSLIVYYDTMEKEIDGELKTIPFLKSSYVFNKTQLTDYVPEEAEADLPKFSLVERIEHADQFVKNTKAIVEHGGGKACYIPSQDKIMMPPIESFTGSQTSTATEAYYGTIFHELYHWTSPSTRLNRTLGKKFADQAYANEELGAELAAAILCAELGIAIDPPVDHANYIAHWLKVIKENKHAIFNASSEASKATNYLRDFQP